MEIDGAIAELSRLLSCTTHPLVSDILKENILKLNAQASSAAQSSKPTVKEAPAAPKTNTSAEPSQSSTVAAPSIASKLPTPLDAKPTIAPTDFETIMDFSWDQTEDMVKVYIPAEGVSKDMVNVEFTPTSFVMKVHNLNGRNYKCAVAALAKPIKVEESSFLVPKSHKRVVVKLKKASSSGYDERSWSNLTESNKPKPTPTNSDDPGAGIMDLMKNMYEDGDDDMKRTIAKAWTESRDGKTPEMPKMPDLPSMPDLSKDLPKMADMMKGI